MLLDGPTLVLWELLCSLVMERKRGQIISLKMNSVWDESEEKKWLIKLLVCKKYLLATFFNVNTFVMLKVNETVNMIVYKSTYQSRNPMFLMLLITALDPSALHDALKVTTNSESFFFSKMINCFDSTSGCLFFFLGNMRNASSLLLAMILKITCWLYPHAKSMWKAKS